MSIKLITNGELLHIEMALERSFEELVILEEQGDYTDEGAYELIKESLEIVQALIKGAPYDPNAEDISLGR